MGIFSGVSKVDRAGRGSNRHPSLGAGTYVLEVERLVAAESTFGALKGQNYFVGEFTVLEVLNETEESNPAGQRVSWFKPLTRDFRSGELDDDGEKNMGKVLQLAGIILADPETGEPAPDAALTEEALEGLTSGDGTALKGLRIVAEVAPMVNKKTGDRYVTRKGVKLVNVYFAVAPE